MWIAESRPRHKLRYPSDVTDEEWGDIVTLIPPSKRGGNKWTIDRRELWEGI